MRPQQLAAWLAAPALAVLLLAIAVVGRSGPGFFLLSLVAGATFLFGVPLLQFLLLRQPQFSGRHCFAAGMAMFTAVLFLAIPLYLGVFSFW